MFESYATIRFIRPATNSAVTIKHLLYLGYPAHAMDDQLRLYHWQHAVRQAEKHMPGWEYDPHVADITSV